MHWRAGRAAGGHFKRLRASAGHRADATPLGDWQVSVLTVLNQLANRELQNSIPRGD